MYRRPQIVDHGALLNSEMNNGAHLFHSAASRDALLYVSNTEIWGNQGVCINAPNECRTWGQSLKLFPRDRQVHEKWVLQTFPVFPAPPQLLLTIYWCIFSGSSSCYYCNVAKNSFNINTRIGPRAGPHVELEIPELSAHPRHCSISVRSSGLSVALIDSWRLSAV